MTHWFDRLVIKLAYGVPVASIAIYIARLNGADPWLCAVLLLIMPTIMIPLMLYSVGRAWK